MHKDVEVQPATIVELDEHTLTDAGKEAWADVLDAEVVRVYNGYYGLQMELDKVKPSRLEEFSSMLVGYCPVSDYGFVGVTKANPHGSTCNSRNKANRCRNVAGCLEHDKK